MHRGPGKLPGSDSSGLSCMAGDRQCKGMWRVGKIHVKGLYYSGLSRAAETIGCVYTQKEIYWKDLAHVSVEGG